MLAHIEDVLIGQNCIRMLLSPFDLIWMNRSTWGRPALGFSVGFDCFETGIAVEAADVPPRFTAAMLGIADAGVGGLAGSTVHGQKVLGGAGAVWLFLW